MSGHTPGPWKVHYGHNLGRPMCVAPVVRWGGLCRPADPTTVANARLIAAAPTLLEALEAIAKGLLETVDTPNPNGGDDIDYWLDLATTAISIAKGTGEETKA